MNLATGALTLTGFLSIVLGIVTKLVGISLLNPYVIAPSNYFLIAITCFVTALVIDRFEKN